MNRFQPRAGLLDTWTAILVCFAVAALVCAAKNYISVALLNTPVCGFLCPSIFGDRAFPSPEALSWLFSLQISAEAQLQTVFNQLLHDRHLLLTGLVVAPALEEGLYRGPLYLFRSRAGTPAWWIAAALLATLFALSHSVAPLSLLPLIMLGVLAAALIAHTGRFWPCIVLHFLYNFFMLSITVLQSFYWAD
jgi:membrane protease YdiL (CAAX protease family)